jgi:hypothetical protein
LRHRGDTTCAFLHTLGFEKSGSSNAVSPTISMMNEQDSERLRRLERKLDWLTRLIYVQIAILTVFGISYMFQVARLLVLFLIIAVPLLIVFRGSLPGWARKIGRLLATFARKSTSP